MSYKIMSFNVQNLSATASSDKLDIIAKIVQKYEVDIVALQEVLDEGKVLTGINLKSVSGAAKAYEHSLKRRLGNDWAMCWRDPHTRAKDYVYLGIDKRGEGYAFLWNTSRVDLLVEDGRQVFPRIYRNYKVNTSNDLIRLIRDPCYGQFKINNRPVEIRLLTTHIVYGKPSAENISADLDYGAVTMRRNEFQILAGQIYPRISKFHKQTSCTSAYTIILGDYNLNLPSSGVGKALLPEIMCFDEKGNNVAFSFDNNSYMINNVQSRLSTINANGDSLASNYDHFSYNNKVASRIDLNGIKVVSPYDIFMDDNSIKEFKEKVSDHLPIILCIDI